MPFGGYDEISYDDLLALLPEGLGAEFGQNVLFAMEFGYDGSDPSVVRPDTVRVFTLVFTSLIFPPRTTANLKFHNSSLA